ncbi:hypothetical protein HDU91_001437 [Kappamyces sp. JEL0680]|nr:hypothetical protein HDU91_001437 [Kappamyces sp. JEL0680]
MSLIEKFKTLLLAWFVWKNSKIVLYYLRLLGPVAAVRKLVAVVAQKTITRLRQTVPGANSLVEKEVEKSVRAIQKDMCITAPGMQHYFSLPVKGLKYAEVVEELDRLSQLGDVDWRQGKISGAVYHGGKDLSRLITEAFSLFTVSNMESEIVSMVVNMYHGGADACGSMTSGGSESIMMSMKTHRDWARKVKGITEPEMYGRAAHVRVVPISVHAAFDKGAQYFGIKLIHAPVGDDGCVLVDKVAAAITANTIMLAGSTPGFPHGAVDNIPALAKLALQHGIGLHVDSCLVCGAALTLAGRLYRSICCRRRLPPAVPH